jgi:hypothetical protein
MPDTPYGNAVKIAIGLWFDKLNFVRDFIVNKLNEPTDPNLKLFANSQLARYSFSKDPVTQGQFKVLYTAKYTTPRVPDGAFGDKTVIDFVNDLSSETITVILERLFGYVLDPTIGNLPPAVPKALLSTFPDLAALQTAVFALIPADFKSAAAFVGTLTVENSVGTILN